MAVERARLNLQDRLSPSRQPYTVRPLKDNHCRDCQKLDAQAVSETCQEACIHRREFAPTPNRFSILAEPEQSPTQTKWAFDFVQPSSPRRRGKRGGKHCKLKLEARKRREAQKSDGLGDLCKKMAALCLNEGPPRTSTAGAAPKPQIQNSLPRSGFTFSTDAVRDHWMPQFRPNAEPPSISRLKPSTPQFASLLQPPESGLTNVGAAHSPGETAEMRRKESRFFPLSAFLASPPSAAGRASAQPRQPALTRKESIEKQPSVVPPTPDQKAAASAACRALALQVANTGNSPPLNLQPDSQAARPSSPPSLVQTACPPPRPITPENPLVMAPPPAPLSITPSHTASPTLSTSPVISSAPSLACAPSVVSAVPSSQPSRAPPPLPPRPVSTRDTPQPWALPSFDCPKTTSPLSLITAPITSPYPFITPPTPSLANLSTSLFAKPKPAVPFIPGLPKRDDVAPVSSIAQFELQEFLRLGHAAQCWCSQSSSPSCHSNTPNPVLRPRSRNKLTVFRKRQFDESNMTAEMDAITLTPSSASSHFEFEDLGSTGCDVLTLSDSDDSEGGGLQEEEEEWTVVTPGDNRYVRPMP
ncbi:hypothetical protein K458DRAFT_186085 [Lentithecium fluviatile CBS 122367]|uniref:Uncharacterized protein n=1 Tax=Lentithecium fluviatile CBS 122367 TaxID=1168545 RepID=A0A6G1J9B8_9PLEO|nr:hypothetical protein K458DRAFT_186085 [Lentithecium fluviatile CBS 122367]